MTDVGIARLPPQWLAMGAALIVAAVIWVLVPRARRRVVAAVFGVSGLVAAFYSVMLALDVATSTIPSGPSPLVFLGAGLIFCLGGLGVAWRITRRPSGNGPET